jgi:peptidase A4-like protein
VPAVVATSTNWSGYVAAVKKPGVTCVEGSWVEPTITCPKTGTRAVAIWVGIDGFSSRTLGVPATNALVQIGTQADCEDGVARHIAWREVLPAEQHEVDLSAVIHPGDHISAQVLYVGGGQFTMSVFDRETGVALSITKPAPGAPRRSADWIVEAPAVNCPSVCTPSLLPGFGTIGISGAVATIAGQRAPINDDAWANVRLRIVRSGVVRTKTSALTGGGTTFSVTWVHS